VRSRRARAAADDALLDAHGRGIVLLELEGPVFFGSAESLAERIDAAVASSVRTCCWISGASTTWTAPALAS